MPDSYELEPQPPKPDLPGQVVVSEDTEDLMSAAAGDLFIQANACVREFGDFHLAISGGQLVESLFLRLMADPLYRALPWSRTQLWVAAESGTDSQCGVSRIVDEVIRHHSGIPAGQIHGFDPRLPDSHQAYEQELLETLGWREKGHDRLDFCAFGVEDWIPGTGVDVGGGRVVSRFRQPDGREWVSLTPWFVCGSRFIALLAGGAGCTELVADACQESVTPFEPVGGIQKWYVDRAAMGES